MTRPLTLHLPKHALFCRHARSIDLAGSEVKFDERGDGLGRYNIYNFRQVRQPTSAPTAAVQAPPTQADQSSAALVAADAAASSATPSAQNSTLFFSSSTAAALSSGGRPILIDDASSSSAAAQQAGAEQQTDPAHSLIDMGVSSSVPPELNSMQQQQQFAASVEHIYTSNVEFEYSSIGRWTENDYYLQLDDIQFIQGGNQIPESYCSRPCELGQAKIMRAGDHCCWICKTCAPYEYLPDEFNCRDCGIGKWPIANKTSCFELPQKYLRWSSIYSLISLSIACFGIALTLFVTTIFVKYLDTPVVKASGRELSFILLAGIAFCHLSTFVLLSKPTTFICGSQRFLVSTHTHLH